MVYRVFADLIVALHLAFILFAVLGGFLTIRSTRWIWAHVPAALWAALVELAGWVCPLTPIEHWLREAGGDPIDHVGFVDTYLVPLVYPEALTRELQVALGIFVLVMNGCVYTWVWRRHRQPRAG